jgi:hypothetical protein
VNRFVHAIAQGCVNELMALDRGQTLEGSRNNEGLEVPPVTLDGQVGAGKPLLDPLRN